MSKYTHLSSLVNNEQLTELYINQHLSCQSIANKYNCVQSAVSKYLHRCGIKMRSRNAPHLFVDSKVCIRCNVVKPISEFYLGRRICKKCVIDIHRLIYNSSSSNKKNEIKEKRREYWRNNATELHCKRNIRHLKNKDLDNKKCVEWYRRTFPILKRKILTHYGNGKCACIMCGFDDIRALSIDHINGEGNRHRKETSGYNIYQLLKRDGFPSGYQTLCMNCQFIKRDLNKECKRKWT